MMTFKQSPEHIAEGDFLYCHGTYRQTSEYANKPDPTPVRCQPEPMLLGSEARCCSVCELDEQSHSHDSFDLSLGCFINIS